MLGVTASAQGGPRFVIATETYVVPSAPPQPASAVATAAAGQGGRAMIVRDGVGSGVVGGFVGGVTRRVPDAEAGQPWLRTPCSCSREIGHRR